MVDFYAKNYVNDDDDSNKIRIVTIIGLNMEYAVHNYAARFSVCFLVCIPCCNHQSSLLMSHEISAFSIHVGVRCIQPTVHIQTWTHPT